MKLRLRGNSLRLRLTRNEVHRLAEGGPVEEAVVFGTGTESVLLYRISTGEADSTQYVAGRIEVVVATASARKWAAGPAEGIYFETASGLRVAVEKDFRCLAPRDGEDDSDAYEHPGGPTACAV